MFGGDAVTTFIINLCSYLSGNIAAAIAVLCIVYTGYEFTHGDIDKKKMIMRCIGIGLIFGGSFIMKTYLLQGISI